jgi:DNA-binding HxlR family transcriptional regulator
MSDERLAQLHEILKDTLSQKILLQLGESDSLSFDDLMKNLKLNGTQELSNQLNTLEKLTIDGEHLVSKQVDLQYSLTEKGHYVLDEMIAFPELESDGYTQKIRKSGHDLGKAIYVVIGASVLGFIFWAILMLVSNASGFRWGMSDLTADYFAAITLIICWIVGGFIGYLIGKKMNYKFPMMQRM